MCGSSGDDILLFLALKRLGDGWDETERWCLDFVWKRRVVHKRWEERLKMVLPIPNSSQRESFSTAEHPRAVRSLEPEGAT